MQTSLWDYAARYVRHVDGSIGYLTQLRWAIRSLERFAERQLYVCDLNEDLLNDYLLAAKDKLSGQTRLSRRNALLRLWKEAARDPRLEHRPPFPNRDLVDRVKRRHRLPEAWSIDDVRKLFAAADRLRGYYDGWLSKRLYWRAYILSAWSTGLRRCDLVEIGSAEITASGRVGILQRKSGRAVFGQLSVEAQTAVAELVAHHKNGKVFPVWSTVQTWRRIAKRLVRRAGLRLSIGKLRASAGTDVELFRPGYGPQFLGNTPEVFYERYFDRRLGGDLPTPRPLTGS